ncbi:MAG: DUF2169 domain-containing protein [Thermodesulfobacteriota bacterium]
MRVVKSDTQSVLFRTFQKKAKNCLAVTILSAFSLKQEADAADGRTDRLLDETDIWDAAGAWLPQGDILDAMMPKPSGEVLLAGRCYSPHHRPAHVVKVHMTVGPIAKTLIVFGQRSWRQVMGELYTVEEPKAFNQMDLVYENAFGGPGHEKNPRGKGFISKTVYSSGSAIPAPNVEDVRHIISSISDRPEPAGLAPLGLDWPQRTRYLGKYDRKWLQTRWPWFPDDFDWRYFNAAPEDQRIQDYFLGDEPIGLENLHPELSKIETALPGLRARCFLQRQIKNEEEFLELKANLDTIWLFPGALIGVLVWHAAALVADDEASDVQALVTGMEPLKENPRPVDYYRTRLRPPEMEVQPEVGAPVPLEEPVSPLAEEAPPTPVRQPALDKEDLALYQELTGHVAAAETEIADLLKKAGLDLEKLAAALPLADLAPGATQVPEDLSLAAMQAHLAEEEAKIADWTAAMKFDPSKISLEPPTGPDFKSLKAIAEELKKTGAVDEQTARQLIQLEEEVQIQEKEIEELLKKAEPGPAESPAEEIPQAGPTEDLGRKLTRAEVIEAHSQGKSLAGADLSELNLSDLDLSGLDLARALLARTDLTRSRLPGAILARANLSEAVLEATDLSGADLSESLMTRVKAAKAGLSGTNCNGADLTGADLTGADLSGALLENALFEQAVLRQARLDMASVAAADFTAADLTQASLRKIKGHKPDFTQTTLIKADFSQAAITAATFDGARGESVSFAGADLREARADDNTILPDSVFDRADLSRGNWEGANLSRSRFRHALVGQVNFTRAALQESDFHRAKAQRARFDQANLAEANLVSLNLFKGDLTKAVLTEANLKGANLFEVEFLKAEITGADFTDAYLKRTKLERWLAK